MTDKMTYKSVLIVGAGVFGAATALKYKSDYPEVQVTLLDQVEGAANPHAAGHDVNKIIRNDYMDEMFVKEVARAWKEWMEEDGMYRQFFEHVGMTRPDPGPWGKEAKGGETKMLSPDEFRSLHKGAFKGAELGALDEVYQIHSAGWAKAAEALDEVIKVAMKKGVMFHKGQARKLILDGGKCTGVKLQDDTILGAELVILAAGAKVAEILFSTDPERGELHAGDRFRAEGAMSFTVQVDEETSRKLQGLPVCKNTLPSVKGEGMGIFSNGIMKLNCDMSFTNFEKNLPDNTKLSVVPDKEMYLTWYPKAWNDNYEQRARYTLEGIYGKEFASKVEFKDFRMCWDCVTPSHDFVIDFHPKVSNLVIATGGSFHAYKFLPTIGDTVVTRIKRELDDERARRFAWDRPTELHGLVGNPTYKTAFDMNDDRGLAAVNEEMEKARRRGV